MLDGSVVTSIKLVAPVVRLHYTDDTWSDIEKPETVAYMQRMTVMEQTLNEHVNTPVPAAHNGIVDAGTPIVGSFEAIFKVTPTQVRMASNTSVLAVSDTFVVELELINRTSVPYGDISFLIQAPNGLKFFPDSAQITIPGTSNPSKVQNFQIQSYQGLYLGPSQRGKFTVLAQQSFASPINTTTAMSVPLVDLSYKPGLAATQKYPVLPINASYQVVP